MDFDMDTLKDIITYLYIKYPYKNELSKARLVKMIYLADWKYALLYKKQLTTIKWYFNHYGPYVSDIIDAIRNDKDFTIKTQTNYYGDLKELIILNEKYKNPSLTNEAIDVLNFVIQKTHSLIWDDFIRLVYSTYPIVSQPRYSNLNLVELANSYKNNI